MGATTAQVEAGNNSTGAIDNIEQSMDFFSFTRPAWILTTTSASISVVFSILVIAFIWRSRTLSSAYHRIMLFMSFWDVVSSLAIALTTLPMPADVHDIYPFAGRAFGNTVTCTCQGLLIFVGSTYTVWSNCTLNIYYVCTIRYGVSEETINRRVLPIMLFTSTVYVTIFGSVLLSLGQLNPRPSEPFCLVGPYPYNCINEESVECIRGDISISTRQFLVKAVGVAIGLFFFCIVTSMALVVLAVFRTEWTDREQYGRGNQSQIDFNSNDFRNTRTALRQALMYIAAFVLTWTWLGVAIVLDSDEPLPVNNHLKLLFQPLQGFFNGVIFLSNKASILRKANPRLTRYQAFRQVILSPSTVPEVLVSQIGAVDEGLVSGDNDDLNIDVQQNDRSRISLPSGSIPSNSTPSFDVSLAVSSKEKISAEGDVTPGNSNPAMSNIAPCRVSTNLPKIIQSRKVSQQMVSQAEVVDIEDSCEVSEEDSIDSISHVKFRRNGRISSKYYQGSNQQPMGDCNTQDRDVEKKDFYDSSDQN